MRKWAQTAAFKIIPSLNAVIIVTYNPCNFNRSANNILGKEVKEFEDKSLRKTCCIEAYLLIFLILSSLYWITKSLFGRQSGVNDRLFFNLIIPYLQKVDSIWLLSNPLSFLPWSKHVPKMDKTTTSISPSHKGLGYFQMQIAVWQR